jgi:hypothetical protein
LILIYDYTTTRFLRTESGDLFVLRDTEDVPKSLRRNKRWIDTQKVNAIDLAYIYVENELASLEGKPPIEIEEEVAV